LPLSRRDLPSVGEHVIATVKEIFEYGAYVELDEFNNLRAYLPWNEVSSKWIRSISDVLRENQKIVVRVIRVDHKRRTVDVSLKRVTDSERRRKLAWWKHYLKACKIIELIASSLGKSIEDAYREVVWKLEEHYGNPYVGLEEAVISGGSALAKAGVPDYWIEPLVAEAKKHIKPKVFKKRAVVVIRTLDRRGVELIRKVLLSAYEAVSDEKSEVRVHTIGSPRYVVEVQAYDPKTAEKTLNTVLSTMEEVSRSLNVEYRVEGVG